MLSVDKQVVNKDEFQKKAATRKPSDSNKKATFIRL